MIESTLLGQEEIKKTLSTFVNEGRIDRSLLSLLVSGTECAPVECELLDYKEMLGEDRVALGRCLIDIVALHNTYGGYLVIGVSETESEIAFRAVGIQRTIDLERIKALLKESTGERVQIAMQYFTIPELMEQTPTRADIAVIFVPKRTAPDILAFGRKGPHDAKNRPVYAEDDVYYRKGDESLLAKGKAILFLAGPRACPYAVVGDSLEYLVSRKARIDHNLPDRSFICSQFIGRREIIDDLWRWFADDFSHVRVLAGEGGLGKTSIAYQFAEEVCTTPESGLERVVWLTAKEKQFSGIQNQMVEVPETHFSSYHELLVALCSELGFLESETTGASEKLLKKYVQQGSAVSPALIVVDDVDSLNSNDQRKVLELGQLFGGKKSRLLITTRANQSYSSDIAFQISGLPFDDYRLYVGSIQERFSGISLTDGQVRAMHQATGGSPLYTESLYRLMRWQKPGNAIENWKGQMGEAVRAAALQREVDMLTPEGKRTLLAAAYLRECSSSELSEVTGYPDAVLGDCITELRSLYLLSATQITDEARFRVSSNTQQFILKCQASLTIDHVALVKRVQELRSQAKGLRLRKENPLVGAAIYQAIAQLRQGNVEEALKTVQAAEKKIRDHPDLLVMRARCLLKTVPARADEARRLAKQAFEGGSRKEILFEVWYEAEWQCHHYVGAADVAKHIIDIKDYSDSIWLSRRAIAKWRYARDQESAGNIDRAIADYWAADDDLMAAHDHASPYDRPELIKRRFEVHDLIWSVLSKVAKDVNTVSMAFDHLRRMIRTGDVRILICMRLIKVLEWHLDVVEGGRGPIGTGLKNLTEQRIREVSQELAAMASKRREDDPRVDGIRSEMQRGIVDRYSEILRVRG